MPGGGAGLGIWDRGRGCQRRASDRFQKFGIQEGRMPRARFENPVDPVTSGFLIEGYKFQYFESTSALLDLYWIFESTRGHLRKSRDNMW